MSDNTQDFSKFGYRELAIAGELLSAYKQDKDKTKFLGDGIKIEFNPNSGNVFIVDEDYNVAMMCDDLLEDFFSCPQCGHEGFLEDMEHNLDHPECNEYLKSIGYFEDKE